MLATLACGCAAACSSNAGVTLPAESRGGCSHVPQKVSCFYREAPSQSAERLIVFVHGVLGGAATSWGTEEQNTSWPAALAEDARFIAFDIYLMSYLTPLLRSASNIYETSLEQLGLLEHQHVFDRYNEIQFIAHSMGGLVVKNMLVTLRARSELEKLRRVRSVTFLGTPAQGAPDATFAVFFSSNPQFRGMEPAHLNEAIQMLEDDWRRLLQARGRGHARFPRVHCAYETLPMIGIGLLVPREMASSDCDGDLQPMALNHSQMAKLIRTNVNPYLWTMGRIAAVAKELDDERLANAVLQEGRRFSTSGRSEDARTAYTKAKALYRSVGQVLGEADALVGLAEVDSLLGRNDEARAGYIQARSIFIGEDDRNSEAHVVHAIAKLDHMFGRTEQARAGCVEAGAIYKAIDSRLGEGDVLFTLGLLDFDHGRYDEALANDRCVSNVLYQTRKDKAECRKKLLSSCGRRSRRRRSRHT
jgi:pimeloyl-ACP methyl ester carboxylesterase